MVTSQNAATPLRLMPPHLVLHDVLGAPALAALLDYALAREADFRPSQVRQRPGEKSAVDAVYRQSLQLRDLSVFEPLLRRTVHDQAHELMARLRMSVVATTSAFETQLVAHGDGGYFKRHIDTATADRARPDVRVLSGVYYFHRQPKAFSGGELRLFDLGDPSHFLDVEPVNNTLLLFPSWAPHEVRPIRCPSQQFADARFSVNCWVYAPLTAAKATG